MAKNRAFEMSKLTTSVVLKELESVTMGLFLSSEQKKEKKRKTQEEVAEIIFSKLSQFKGSGLKLLQSLSLDEGLLPEAYRKRFAQAYGQAMPLSRPLVKKVIQVELGGKPEDLFAEFDYNCISAASIGQVHRAKTFDGQLVAVKVQYPNVDSNIRNDMKLIQDMVHIIGNPLIKNTVRELANSIIDELDYQNELKNINLFRPWASEVGLGVPLTFPKLSTERVLTMSLLPGVPLSLIDDAVNLQPLFNFFINSLRKGSALYGDPHPGNFLIDGDGINLVDFGSTKTEIPSEVCELFFQLIGPQEPSLRSVELYESLGAEIGSDPNQFYESHIRSFWLRANKIFNCPKCDFSQKRSDVVELRKFLFKSSADRELANLSADFSLLHKSFQSLLFVFCRNGSLINTCIDEQN